MTNGYLYCLSNKSIPGLLKIGMTLLEPEVLLEKANSFSEWCPPDLYVCEFSKYVKNAKKKYKTLYILLDISKKRYMKERDFFTISKNELLHYFDLMEGTMFYSDISNSNDKTLETNVIKKNSNIENGEPKKEEKEEEEEEEEEEEAKGGER